MDEVDGVVMGRADDGVVHVLDGDGGLLVMDGDGGTSIGGLWWVGGG